MPQIKEMTSTIALQVELENRASLLFCSTKLAPSHPHFRCFWPYQKSRLAYHFRTAEVLLKQIVTLCYNFNIAFMGIAN